MTANDYFQSIPLEQQVQPKELRFHLYMFQHWREGPQQNQGVITDIKRPRYFGHGAVNDWIIRDSPNLQANIVARGQGLHLGAGRDEENWFTCFNIVFTNARLMGSSLQVLGNFAGKSGQLAIVGGTGELAFAHGVATATVIQEGDGDSIRELQIRAMCLAFLKPVPICHQDWTMGWEWRKRI
ncbi:hypothetical protein CFC21_048950 [Triticum aestivum]|uniref:Dirigent protein n=2 Tax=Triticum aestivum TaxID=4565 RepID=A0A9R1G2S2_WHEAT|nr:uncharacterized protein LOC109748679 isoform X2 [Aegilops tauschii subsp. strangulata]KAF7038837.1 hypothetical protein CFC21_048950 [Triticum aestivum]